MADKPKMKYQVLLGTKPGTAEVTRRAAIVGLETYYNDTVVSYALNNGYVRGKPEDVRQNFTGLVQTVKDLVDAGYDVNFADWLRIHLELNGSVGADGQLGAANGLSTVITPLKKFKDSVSIDNFSWENVDDTGLIVKIDSVLTPSGEAGEVKKNHQILLTGKNLVMLTGDTINVVVPGIAAPIALTASESDYAHILCLWNSALDSVAAGTELTFIVKGRAGIEDAAPQTSTKTAVLANA